MSIGAERVCTRCGTAAGSAWFCRGCGLNLASEKELPTRDEWEQQHPDGWTRPATPTVMAALPEPVMRRSAPAQPRFRAQPEFVTGAPTYPDTSEPVSRVYWVALAGLALCGLALVLYVIDSLHWIRDANAIEPGLRYGTLTYAQALAGTNARHAVDDALLLVYVSLFVSGICFLVWFVKTYKRMERRGVPFRFSSDWALWSWFVPILSLWRPKQITNDLWRATRRDPQPSLAMLNWWWGLWLAAGWVFAIGWVLSRTIASNQTALQVLRTQRAGYWIGIFGCGVYAAAGVLLAIIVWQVSRPEV